MSGGFMRDITGISPPFFAAAGFAILLILFSACAGFVVKGQAGTENGVEGVYEGLGQGYRGPIRVQIRMEAGVIVEIAIVESGEDRAVGGAAMEELLDMVLMYNTADIDAISGATESSNGFLAAVEQALNTAQAR
jgi:uncharacterized protein with FMN-binding domain